MAKSFKTALDLGKNELRNLVLENLSSAPASPVKGQKYFNSTDNYEYYYNGSEWVKLAAMALVINNNGENRLLTSNAGVASLEAEANLLFDGTYLTIGSLLSLGNGAIGINIGGQTPAFHLDMVGDMWQSGGSAINLAVDRTAPTRKWRIARDTSTHRLSIFHTDDQSTLTEVFGVDYSSRQVRFNGAYSFPTSIGSAGQSLRLPSSGSLLEWYTPASASDSLQITAQPSTDHSASGVKVQLTAYHSLSFGDVCRVHPTAAKAQMADAVDNGKVPALFMCLETSLAADATGWFLCLGVARDDSWNFSVGDLVYLAAGTSNGNTLTQTAPSSSGNIVQVLGVATHGDRLYFNPSKTFLELV